MLNRKRRSSESKNGFYWQAHSASDTQAFVEVLPIKVTQINEFYVRTQSQKTRQLINELFLQRNVPRFINKLDKRHLILDYIYDERDAASLQIWSRLSEYPPTHTLIVGYMVGSSRSESIRLTLSLACVGNRQAWAVQLLGLLISRLLGDSRDGFLLTPNKINAEFWLQCAFAVVCSIREG